MKNSDEWQKNYAAGPNQEAAAAAPKFPKSTTPSQLQGKVVYCLWGSEYIFNMVADVRGRDTEMRLYAPNEETRKNRLSKWVEKEKHLKNMRIMGKNDVQKQVHST